MKQNKLSKRAGGVPKDAVLLIPEQESENEPPAYGINPGYYNSKQMLDLIDRNKGNVEAIHFIADMLEIGDPEHDGFSQMIRRHCDDAAEIARIVQICRDDL